MLVVATFKYFADGSDLHPLLQISECDKEGKRSEKEMTWPLRTGGIRTERDGPFVELRGR